MADLYTSIRRFVMPLLPRLCASNFSFAWGKDTNGSICFVQTRKNLLITVSDSFPVSRVPALNGWSQKLRSIYASIFVTRCPLEIKNCGSKRYRTWSPLDEYNVASNSTRETFSSQFFSHRDWNTKKAYTGMYFLCACFETIPSFSLKL